MPERAGTLLVIPTYNEADNIERLIREVAAQALPLDILVIDDNSPDGTGRLAESLSREIPLKVIHRKGKLGIGSAHKEGFRYALEHGYATTVTMDADFAHSPECLREMFRAAATSDVVVGSRYLDGGGLQGWGLPRLLLTHTAHWLTNHLLAIPYDCTGGFRLYHTRVLDRIHFGEIQSEGYAFLIEMLFHVHQQGFSVTEIPIVISSRRLGKSKISRSEILRAVKLLLRLSLQRMRGMDFRKFRSKERIGESP